MSHGVLSFKTWAYGTKVFVSRRRVKLQLLPRGEVVTFVDLVEVDELSIGTLGPAFWCAIDLAGNALTATWIQPKHGDAPPRLSRTQPDNPPANIRIRPANLHEAAGSNNP